MRNCISRLLAGLMCVVSLLFGTAQPVSANHSGSMHYPSADYCGWVYKDPANVAHNGVDVWTNSAGTGLYSSAPMKGFPVQLAAEGVFKGYQTLSETGEPDQVYGLRFYHPALNVSTFYWHLAPSDTSNTTYVQLGYVVDTTYPAGTFLGYQGNLSAKMFNDETVHLHFTVTAGQSYDYGKSPADDPNMLDPTPYFNTGKNFNGVSCNLTRDIQYRGPLPTSPNPYPANFERWFVVTNWQTSATATKLEFNLLDTESGYDYVSVYQYSSTGFSLRHSVSGQVVTWGCGCYWFTDLIPGRVVFIHFSSDSSVEYDGFRVSNYHVN